MGQFFSTFLRHLESPGENGTLKEYIQEAGRGLMQWEHDRYGNFMAHMGDWPDHAISTKMKRARMAGQRSTWKKKGDQTFAQQVAGQHFPLLWVNGDLFNSLLNGEPFYMERFYGGGALFMSVTEYGHYHQTGTPKMPARPFVVEPPFEEMQKACGLIGQGVQGLIDSLVPL